MGVKETPAAEDFAYITQRVHEDFQRSKEITLAPHVEVLKTCLEGFHSCVKESGHHISKKHTFFFLDREGKVADVSELVPCLNKDGFLS